MSQKINIGLIQTSPEYLNVKEALDKLTNLIDRYGLQTCDLLVLPELWNSAPLRPNQNIAELNPKDLLNSLVKMAQSLNTAIISPMAEPSPQSNEKPFNSSFVITPQGKVDVYRKINLFPLLKEDKTFSAGNEIIACDVSIANETVTISPLICYDLRFPELAKTCVCQGADIIIYSALWPKQRLAHFHGLLKARAIENQCFVVGVNSKGHFDNIEFGGGSMVVSPSGKTESITKEEEVLITTIDLGEISKARSQFCTARPSAQWPPLPESKIVDRNTLQKICQRRKKALHRMVFTNGCFDILHAGHVDYLNKARKHGDYLVVALNSDSSVRSIKGPSRPINPQLYRAKVLASLECVDYVTIFDELDPGALIKQIVPDILVKGADWEENEIIGRDIVVRHGGKVIRIPFKYDISTTNLIKQISNKSNS